MRFNSGWLERAVQTGLLLALAFSSMAFGAIEPWALTIFEVIILILMLLQSAKAFIDERIKIYLPPLMIPAAALLFYGLIQSISFADKEGYKRSLSVDAGATRDAALAFFFLIAAFALLVNSFQTREQVVALAHFLIWYGLAMALFGILQHMISSDRIYWVRQNLDEKGFGPFLNRNHFAGYLELLIPIPIAFVIHVPMSRRRQIIYCCSAALMGVAVILSLSRGGMISLMASFVFLAVFSKKVSRSPNLAAVGTKQTEPQSGASFQPAKPQLARHQISRPLFSLANHSLSREMIVIGAIGATIATGIFLIGPAPIFERIARGSIENGPSMSEAFFKDRGWIWEDSLRMIRSNPALGVGFGAYSTAFPIYTHSDGTLLVSYAHNDYLQILTDCGIIGGLTALAFIALLARAFAQSMRSHDKLALGLAIGTGGGIFAILVHSLFDYNLQVPSNTLLFLFLCSILSRLSALAVKQNHSRRVWFKTRAA